MSDMGLDSTQLERYSRHVIMEGVGADGQGALLDAAVLVVGAGGLGSPVIQYLAAAGVGTIGIADDDVVERSNLQRQVIHRDADVGRSKVESAAEFVNGLNPDVDVRTHETRITGANVEELIAQYDFVVDGSDNFPTRFLINDACTLTGTPFAHGAVYKFEGQVTTFDGGEDGPCYRCLFPEAPEEGTVPSCAETGILGSLPGTVGAIEATETLKSLMDVGERLSGRLLLFDSMDMSFEEVPIRQNPDCPVCGDDPAIESVAEVEYSGRCALED